MVKIYLDRLAEQREEQRVRVERGTDPNELIVHLEFQPAWSQYHVLLRKRVRWKGRTFVVTEKYGPFKEVDWFRSLI